MLDTEQMKRIVEAAIFAAGEPLNLDKLLDLFDENEKPSKPVLKELIEEISKSYETSALELKEVASGYRFQAKAEFAPWLQRLWEKKPARYSRALLETLALVVYRQPITRGEIEDVRGVAVSTQIMKTLLEHEWIKIVGHKDIPGKPALFGTTQNFLDYFNLKSLSELPALQELVNLDELEKKLMENESTGTESESESESLEEAPAEVEELNENSKETV